MMKITNLFRRIFLPKFISKDDYIFSLICREVSKRYHIPIRLILSKTRERHICEKRQIIQTMACDFTNLRHNEIAKRTHRNHSTIVHSRKAVHNAIQTDKRFATEYYALHTKISGKLINI